MPHIASRDNPRFKHLCAIAGNARERRAHNQTVLDGAHLLAALLDAGLSPVSIWVSDDARDAPEIASLLARAGQEPFVLPAPLLKHAAPTESPSGILTLIDIPSLSPRAGLVVALEGVQDAGNVGSILRSAAAAGAGQAWLSAGCAAAWSPKVLRAGMGAQFQLPVIENADLGALIDARGGEVLATLPQGAVSVFDAKLSGAPVWLFGAEGAGLSEALAARATQRVLIPMPGAMESLNVAAAAAVCLFESVRRGQRA